MANINSPGQIVISGAAENVTKAMALATAAGASRAIPSRSAALFTRRSCSRPSKA